MKPARMAHYQPIRMAVPDATQPVDKWEHDALIVLGAIAFLLVIAGVAVLVEKGFFA